MKKLLDYVLSCVYLLYFSLVLLVFHVFQVGAFHLFGKDAHKKTVDATVCYGGRGGAAQTGPGCACRAGGHSGHGALQPQRPVSATVIFINVVDGTARHRTGRSNARGHRSTGPGSHRERVAEASVNGLTSLLISDGSRIW